MTNKEMAERTDLSKSTVTRLSRTLVKLGYLRQPGMHGKYHLDDSVTDLGNAYLRSLTLTRVAEPLMMDFAQKHQTSVAIGVGHGHQMIYVCYYAGSETATMRLSVGAMVPLHKSAIGLAYLSALTRDQQAAHLDAITYHYPEDDLTHLPLQIADTRNAGFSVSFSAWRRDIYAAGAPLWLDSGNSIAAINCGARQRNQSRDHYVETLGPELIILSSKISSGMDRIGATFKDE